MAKESMGYKKEKRRKGIRSIKNFNSKEKERTINRKKGREFKQYHIKGESITDYDYE